ncbi:hypothetical protein ACTXPS_16205 [Brachybacterium tyrofermentans]|uniref:hypothetical protein n=1 Tax=Brachybacterium tyrofermentans TaxID=47848 RepID=UPI003FD0578F
MSSALIGLALILLIAVVTVALGALTRLLAARIVGPRSLSDAPLTPLERIALGNEIIARDLQPDDTHPIARTASRDARAGWADGPVQRQDLAVRYPEIAAHALR